VSCPAAGQEASPLGATERRHPPANYCMWWMHCRRGVSLWIREWPTPASPISQPNIVVGQPCRPWWPKHLLLGGKAGAAANWQKAEFMDLLLAKFDFDIMGADFLRHLKLAVDLAGGQLVDTQDMCSLAGEASLAVDGSLLAAVAATSPQYCSLFSYYPAVADTSGKLPIQQWQIPVASCHLSSTMWNIFFAQRSRQLLQDFNGWMQPICRRRRWSSP
jgi:hypothetical protein